MQVFQGALQHPCHQGFGARARRAGGIRASLRSFYKRAANTTTSRRGLCGPSLQHLIPGDHLPVSTGGDIDRRGARDWCWCWQLPGDHPLVLGLVVGGHQHRAVGLGLGDLLAISWIKREGETHALQKQLHPCMFASLGPSRTFPRAVASKDWGAFSRGRIPRA